MLKDLIGTILGRKDPMYRLFGIGFALIKILELYALNRAVPGFWSLDFYLLSLSSILPILAALGILASVISVVTFIAAKILRKKVNFSQLFFAMHSILPFFLIIKLLQTFSILAYGTPILIIIFNILIIPATLYFIFIMAKTASYFTTMSLGQSILIMIILLAGFVAAIYGLYLFIINLATASLI
ncbi:MAG: hypothetical protein CXT77_03990 [uncultured DHVE6 group euryarchaeote]|nr:MAG: hypothetical protein CXT77_03990 [uncultured DHVE6 group euryarchaeote]